jgi:hypothetical protein
MNTDLLLIAIGASICTALIGFALWHQAAARQAQLIGEQRENTQKLEKQIHLQERDFLAERNQLEITHADNVRIARAEAFEDGRRMGLIESNADHMNELSLQRLELLKKFETEREQALTEVRDKVRAEYELQTKLFSVKISPYVCVREDKGILRSSYETAAGYQYQLLVNGIPAFTPHVVTEHTEIKKEVNPEVERLLIRTAERAADAAISLYLGGSPQFAKLAEPIIKRIPKV